MKRANLLLVLLLIGLVGCIYNSLPDDMASPIAVSEQGFDLTFSTRAEAFDGVELDSEYFVAEHDLESYLNYKQKHSGKKINIKNYSAYGFDNSHTLFYVINYDKGWEVVSADKRTQPTLAYGDGERTFSMGADNTNEAEKFWMEMLASDVLQKRQRSHSTRSTDTNNLIADEEEQSNVAFWNRVCVTNGTKAIEIDSPSALPWTPTNHIYTLGTTTDTVVVRKGPYTITQWGQWHPWNTKCPQKSNNNGERAPAGCVAVAGGQLLYYLAYKYDIPISIPYDAEVVGNTLSYNFVHSTEYTHNRWDDMALTQAEWSENYTYYTDNVAQLLAWLGYKVDMEYGDERSGSDSIEMMTVISNYGFAYSSSPYNSHIFYNQLDSLCMPVYISAKPTGNDGGHAWLADGIIKFSHIDRVYYLVSDTQLDREELLTKTFADASHVLKYALQEDYLHFNWGASGRYSGYYYLPSTNWIVEDQTYNRDIILYYNFSPLER